VPSEASIEGARAMLAQAALPRAGDVVLCGVTGGSSALLTLPADGLSLADLQSLTKLLLTCGANIFEINAVRKHVSMVGGGRLAQRFDPGVHLVNITVSDVIGDALDYVTDPTVADTSTVADARATLDRFDLWERVPRAVADYLRPGGGVQETPKSLPWPPGYNVLLLSASSPAQIAQRVARELGYNPVLLSASFDGESRTLGETFAAIAREVAENSQPACTPCALIGGGETIVRMNGFGGFGGPNQEFALAGALQLPRDHPAVILGADTDGTDGPTQVAGALCDLSTLSRGESLGVSIAGALAGHNVTPALLKLDDVILTGATGTNVNDLKLLLLA
jgi:glycerate-2-kinase